MLYRDIEVGFDQEPEAGLADNGGLESDLTALMIEKGICTKAACTALVILIDELQYVQTEQFAFPSYCLASMCSAETVTYFCGGWLTATERPRWQLEILLKATFQLSRTWFS